MFSKGKVSAEELQGQLGESLAGAVLLYLLILMNLTPAELDKALEQGKVTLRSLWVLLNLKFKKYGEIALDIANSSCWCRPKTATVFIKR